jgi:energy-coupling factor transporter ATP-binding protein EcfA2
MIDFTDLTFTYPGTEKPVLQGVSLHIPAGELCLVMGPSGAGKSTLLRCINGLVPHFTGGRLRGNILVNGFNPVALSPHEMSHIVGFVFQDPEAQFVVDVVEDEVAFSMENAGISASDMELRIEEALQLLDMTPLRSRRLETLSGGERQRVAIAAALALRPQILVLDEPTSQLDPHGSEEVLQTLVHLNKQLGLTIVLAEHRLERVVPYVGQIVFLSDEYPGGLTGKPRDVLCKVQQNPPVISLGKAFGWDPLPLTVEEAHRYVVQTIKLHPVVSKETRLDISDGNGKQMLAFIQVKDVYVKYGDIRALEGVDLNLYPGEISVMMGPNGAGKSTLLRSLVGLTPIQAGSIYVGGKDIIGRSVADICQQVGYLPQDPNALLFADTVSEELLITLRNHKLDAPGAILQSNLLLDRLGLGDKANAYPRDLSTGERQRVAMGAVMVTKPGALLLDEPTRGLDYHAKHILLDLLRGWREEGMAILLVTHDVELAVQAADRIIILDNGLITADGDPVKVLADSPVFSPQVAKIFPGRGWLTVDDAIGGMNASQHRDQGTGL